MITLKDYEKSNIETYVHQAFKDNRSVKEILTANLSKGVITQEQFYKAMDQYNDLLEKAGGEGSRGGKIIGHTRSGKAIYAGKSVNEYKDFSAEDHADASSRHMEVYQKHKSKGEKLESNSDTKHTAETHKNVAEGHGKLSNAHKDEYIKKLKEESDSDKKKPSFSDKMQKTIDKHKKKFEGYAIKKALDEKLEKGLIDELIYLKANVQLDNLIEKASGEGSRGGRVIGHTRSGKAIYLHENNSESTSAGGIHASNFKNWTKEDHLEAIHAHNEAKQKINEKWHKEHQEHLSSGSKERYNPSNSENKDRVNHLHNIDAHHYALATKHSMAGQDTLRAAYDHHYKNKINSGDDVKVKNTGAEGKAHYQAEGNHHYVKFKDGSDGYFKEHELEKK